LRVSSVHLCLVFLPRSCGTLRVSYLIDDGLHLQRDSLSSMEWCPYTWVPGPKRP
ncbi:hypothetical protein X975_06813, partial [Stegodyphus mimosarum]